MRVAIVHDLLLEYGGAERVLDSLLELYPQADLYTFFYAQNVPHLKKYAPRLTGSSVFSQIPALACLGRYFSLFKFISWIYFYFLDLSNYDCVITSCHSYGSKGVRVTRGARQICYLYTSPRYLYGETHELFFLTRFPFSLLFFPLKLLLRALDRALTTHPDILLAVSKNTQRKITRHYNRESAVVYPPVLPAAAQNKKVQRTYYIAQARLVHQKGFPLILRTCKLLNLPLVVIGEGHDAAYLRSLAGRKTIFVGAVSDEQVDRLYAGARALIYAAHSDDFGLVPVEALARGVPLIAYFSGGVQEILQPDRNGCAFYTPTVPALIAAIRKFEATSFSERVCRESAVFCTQAVFEKKIQSVVREAYAR